MMPFLVAKCNENNFDLKFGLNQERRQIKGVFKGFCMRRLVDYSCVCWYAISGSPV